MRLQSILTLVATALALALGLADDTHRDSYPNALWSWRDGDVPAPRTGNGPYTPSACANGGDGGPPYAYACPHHAMLSDDMMSAAAYDGLSRDFVYAVAGSSADAQCGECYQVQLLDAERVWRPDFPQLVVQVINSGFDVMHGQLDVFVGAGGMGYFTACNEDCKSRYCGGGPCKEGLFGGDFTAWTYSPFPDPNPCYSGGLRLLNETSDDELVARCRALSGDGNRTRKDEILLDTCVRANRELFHQNFVATRYLRVQCPKGLYRLTGLRRDEDDDARFPPPSLANNAFTNECRGARESGKYCVTSMADGCVPSCAWPGKVRTDPQYPRVDRCGKDGSVLS
jgi:hypothetical protein